MTRFREITQSHNVEMTQDAMMRNAPSIFADQPYHDVSDKYGFIPTIQVVEELADHGWLPVDATQKNVRIKAKQDFTKHLIRFRRLNDDIIINDSAVELVLTNSHDRSSGFVLHAGVFRMACANGIIVADSTFQKVNVRHNKHAAGRVIEGAYSVVNEVPAITSQIETMSDIQLSEGEQRIFAETALNYVLPEPKEVAPVIVSDKERLITQALRPKRQADKGSDLWSTFNVVQEKVLRGGITMMKQNEKGRYTRSTTREVKSIDRGVKLNKALWEMAEKMKDIKLQKYAA